jgi:hypothetical protein
VEVRPPRDSLAFHPSRFIASFLGKGKLLIESVQGTLKDAPCAEESARPTTQRNEMEVKPPKGGTPTSRHKLDLFAMLVLHERH